MLLSDATASVDPALLPGTYAQVRGISLTMKKSTAGAGSAKDRLVTVEYEVADVRYTCGSYEEAATPSTAP